MSIHVQLERFEGPLGLLLHLIREQEMDIFNINIHHITRQYLDYIRTMKRLDLEIAGEFVAMAATLLQIKSRMLLPQYNEEGEEITPEDPRKDLVQKLVEYKKFKELSGELSKLAWLGRDVFARGEREVIAPEVAESELILEENPLFSLIASYRAALRNLKKSVHKVSGELQSIAARIMEMRPKLVIGRRVLFRDFITASENVSSQVLVTFLSLLELAKMGLVSVFQSEPFADIHIETKHEVDQDSVSRAENYDSVNSDMKAAEIIHDAELTLDEPVDALEGEDETVVEASVADAASDADIEAEEARLFGDHVASETALDFAADEALVVATDLGLAGDGTEFVAQTVESDESAEDSPEFVAQTNAPEVSADSVPQNFVESQEFVAQTDVPEVGPEFVTQTHASEASADSVAQNLAESASNFVAQTPESAPSPAPIPNPAHAPQSGQEKLNSALNAAFSAFEAFEEIPTPPTPEPPPEVES